MGNYRRKFRNAISAWHKYIADEEQIRHNKYRDFYHDIKSQRDLIETAKFLGVRPDWHEPDEQEVTVRIAGEVFDNAGTDNEILVNIYKENICIATINLATLFSYACNRVASNT